MQCDAHRQRNESNFSALLTIFFVCNRKQYASYRNEINISLMMCMYRMHETLKKHKFNLKKTNILIISALNVHKPKAVLFSSEQKPSSTFHIPSFSPLTPVTKSTDQLAALRATSYSRVLCDVSPDMLSLQAHPMKIESRDNPRLPCDSYEPLDLEAWRDGAPVRYHADGRENVEKGERFFCF